MTHETLKDNTRFYQFGDLLLALVALLIPLVALRIFLG